MAEDKDKAERERRAADERRRYELRQAEINQRRREAYEKNERARGRR